MPREPRARVDPEWVRDVAEAVYRDRLGPKDTASMIEKDGDGGKKLRSRAGTYDVLVVPFARALGVPVRELPMAEVESADGGNDGR